MVELLRINAIQLRFQNFPLRSTSVYKPPPDLILPLDNEMAVANLVEAADRCLSITVCNHYLAEICKIARAHNCLNIVDAVCALSTTPLNMDDRGTGAAISDGQKGPINTTLTVSNLLRRI